MDILNIKCDDANCNMNSNDLNCLISFFCVQMNDVINCICNYLESFVTFMFHKVV